MRAYYINCPRGYRFDASVIWRTPVWAIDTVLEFESGENLFGDRDAAVTDRWNNFWWFAASL